MQKILRGITLWITLLLAIANLLTERLRAMDIITGTEACGATLVCENQGRCYEGSCICMDGYTGTQCETELTCPNLGTLLYNIEFSLSHDAQFGALVTYSCIEGYQFPDVTEVDNTYKRIVMCNKDGVWGPQLEDCVPMCPKIATWKGYLVDNTGRLPGTEIIYDCYGVCPDYMKNAGMLLYQFKQGDVGEQVATCMGDGTWEPPLLECMELLGSDRGDASHIGINAVLIFLAVTRFLIMLF